MNERSFCLTYSYPASNFLCCVAIPKCIVCHYFNPLNPSFNVLLKAINAHFSTFDCTDTYYPFAAIIVQPCQDKASLLIDAFQAPISKKALLD
jgi:hypothetical protein